MKRHLWNDLFSRRSLAAGLLMLALASFGGVPVRAESTPSLPAALKPADARTKLVLVEFSAPWCLGCQLLKPEMKKLGTELGDNLKIVDINIEKPANQAYVKRYKILSAPTVILFNGAGKPLHTLENDIPPEELRRVVLHYYAKAGRSAGAAAKGR